MKRTDLRSYAGEQGVPFRYPPEEASRPQPFDPLTPVVMVALYVAALFIFALAVAGWLA